MATPLKLRHEATEGSPRGEPEHSPHGELVEPRGRDAARCRRAFKKRAPVMRLATALFCLVAASGLSGRALAACPQELAVYTELDGETGIDFRPEIEAAVVTNSFRLVLPRGPLLEGHVIWNDALARPDGALMLDCPQGDVTGAEIAACTHWQGVVYALDAEGKVGLLPAQGEDAAERLLLTDLSRALRRSALNDGNHALPAWDVFVLSGCQE